VRLSLREKQSFYHSLAQLLRTGVPFPAALDKLALTSRAKLRNVIQRMRDAVAEGQTVGEAFGATDGAIGSLETSVVTAVERGGRLDHGLQQLARYFEALAQARETILRKAAYPLFVFHFGVLILGAPDFITGGVSAYVRSTVPVLISLYVVAILLIVVLPLLAAAAASSAGLDRALRAVPLVGKMRRSFAVARFCLIYDVGLDAGVNIIEALLAAGNASRSGLIKAATEAAVPQLRTGAQVGPILAASNAFPEEVSRALLVGEETGELDRELQRMAVEYQADALIRLETTVEWLSKLLYVGIVLVLGWRILKVYQGIYSSYSRMLDS